MAKLRLRKAPKVEAVPTVTRSLAAIDDGLRGVFRSLVAGESPWPLFLHGPAGTGKTCASLCLLGYADGWGASYWTVPALCADVIRSQQGRMDNAAGYKVWPEDFWRTMGQRSLVVLDELASRDKVSDAAYEAVKLTIDARQGKPLVCVSNLNLEAITRIYDDRIASRLASGTAVELVGKDRRIERSL